VSADVAGAGELRAVPAATCSRVATQPTPGRLRTWACPPPAAGARSASPGSASPGFATRSNAGHATG